MIARPARVEATIVAMRAVGEILFEGLGGDIEVGLKAKVPVVVVEIDEEADLGVAVDKETGMAVNEAGRLRLKRLMLLLFGQQLPFVPGLWASQQSKLFFGS